MSTIDSKSKLTFEDVRIKLGLEPFETFRYPNAPENRGTGRTTEMLINAVVASQDNDVTIVGDTVAYSDMLVKQARDYANIVGLDPLKIVFRNKTTLDTVVFRDHYYKNKGY